MDSTLLIFACIALAALAVLCVAATIVLLNSRKQFERVVVTMENIQGDVTQIKGQLEPVLERSATVLSDVQRIVENADARLDQLSQGIETFSTIAKDVRDLEHMVVGKLRGPLEDIVGMVAGAVRGVTAFTKKIVN